MNCPFCAFEGPRRALHAHVTEAHADEVKTSVEQSTGKLFYDLQCPYCGQTSRRQVKPRLRDPSFLEEYSREIRLVAFDVFLYHLEEVHDGDGQRLQHS